MHQYYQNLQAIFSALPDSYGDHLPRLRSIEENVANLPYERFCRDQAVFGDAAEVVDRLQAARDEFGLSQIICWFDQGSSCRAPRSSARCGASPRRSCPKYTRRGLCPPSEPPPEVNRRRRSRRAGIERGLDGPLRASPIEPGCAGGAGARTRSKV